MRTGAVAEKPADIEALSPDFVMLLRGYKESRRKNTRLPTGADANGFVGPYLPPTPEQYVKFRRLVSALMYEAQTIKNTREAISNIWIESVEKQAQALGMMVEKVEGSTSYWWLHERVEQRRGWGGYLIRRGTLSRELILQAPHTFHDEGTGPMALQWLGALPFRAVFFNTVHRYSARMVGNPSEENPAQEGDDSLRQAEMASLARAANANSDTEVDAESDDHCITDAAHNPNHPFQAATEGLSALTLGVNNGSGEPRRAVWVIQLHGFKRSHRTGEAELIISESDRRGLSSEGERMAAALERLQPGLRRYPSQIRRLGGLTNVQADWVHQTPGLRFLHVELSDGLRANARAAPEQWLELGRALISATGPQ